MTDIINLVRRHIPFENIGNFRDLGGYQTDCGREVKWGKVYRSATLFKANDDEINRILNQIGIRHIVDLRKDRELQLEPHPKQLLDKVNYHWLPFNLDGTTREDIDRRLREGSAAEAFEGLLIDVNRSMVTNHINDMKRWFHILLEHDEPILFHCTEGKDRTGFTAAIFLSALGVSREQIMQDYMLTNIVNRQSIEERVKKSEVLLSFDVDAKALECLLAVDEDYLNAAFNQIEKDFDNVANYLIEALSVDADKISRLKDRYVL